MNEKSILELAVDLAFNQMEQDILRKHDEALRAILERTRALQKEVELIYKAEVSCDTQ